jgi:hypothetical protein
MRPVFAHWLGGGATNGHYAGPAGGHKQSDAVENYGR